MQGDDADMCRQIEREFAGWRVWRARRGDQPGRSWVATRWREDAGPDPTVMADSAELLREALAEQRRAASAGQRCVDPGW